MLKSKYFILLLSLVFPFATQAKFSCKALFLTEDRAALRSDLRSTPKENSKVISDEHLAVEDYFIEKHISQISSTYTLWGQPRLEVETYNKAVRALRDSGLKVSEIQKVHRQMTNNKANLKFRETSEAYVIGDYSFTGHVLLTHEQIANVEANPFLSFKPADDAKPLGLANRDKYVIGDIMFPSVDNFDKFKNLVSEATREKVGNGKRLSERTKGEANSMILKDLLEWSLRDAQARLDKKNEPAHIILAELEWRVKSLGLYHEPIHRQAGRRGLESTFTGLAMNRSNELAEALVEAFAIQNNLLKQSSLSDKSGSKLLRGYRPALHESLDAWVSYMHAGYFGRAQSEILKLEKALKAIEKDLPQTQSEDFKNYYLTRLMTGVKEVETADSILRDFQQFRRTHLSRNLKEEERVGLIPIDFIDQFGEKPQDHVQYLKDFYFEDTTIFRGVSNPWELSTNQIAEYFNSFKGRLASEMARSEFDRRTELAKLSMLKFNQDLINGTVVETATQHAAKHTGYDRPNSAKTYYVSTTDLNTVAFRFAMDKGYVTSSSASRRGNTFFVIESLLPKAGAVDFSSFKKVDPSWKNHYPRQFETTVVGGIDPNSVTRIYILEPYSENEQRPYSGPEKHGRIIRILERNLEKANTIRVLEKNEADEWVQVEEIELR